MVEADVQERIRGLRALATPSCLDGFRLPSATGDPLDLASLTGVVEFSPADQVVVVRSGTRLGDLNAELAAAGQTVPHLFPAGMMSDDPPLFALVDYNLPHILQSQCGSWRDWVLGMKVVLADATERRCGSKAVKNVAGYDVQKLMIGARGTLGIVTELTLRTYPISALPSPELVLGDGSWTAQFTVRRSLRTRFECELEEAGAHLICADRAACTLWISGSGSDGTSREKSEWVLRAGCGDRNLEIVDPAVIDLMRRAKSIFDPESKLNPGAMGVC